MFFYIFFQKNIGKRKLFPDMTGKVLAMLLVSSIMIKYDF